MPSPIKIQSEIPPAGVLPYDGERIQCHICGCWYRGLMSHIRIHNRITAEEYREEFGLNRGQELCSPDISKKLEEHFRRRGLVGCNKRYDWRGITRSYDMRQQHRLAVSKRRRGQKMTKTPLLIRTRLENLKKARILGHCCICSKNIIVIKGKYEFGTCCKECRPEKMRQWWKVWRENHPDYNRDYRRRYRLRQSGMGLDI